MIKVTNIRKKPGEGPYAPVSHEKTVSRALMSFALYELGFGGTVTDVNETKITTVTHVMGCEDTTIFEGSPEDIRHFAELAYVHLKVIEQEDQSQMFAELLRFSGGNPRVLTMGAELLVGQSRIVKTLVAGIGTPETVARLLKLKKEDLMEVYSLVRVDGQDLETALSLAE